MVAKNTNGTETDCDLFLRMWKRESISPTLARQLLKFRWTDEELERMKTLADRNREGLITEAETREMDRFLRVGMMMSILQSRARKVIKGKGVRGRVRV